MNLNSAFELVENKWGKLVREKNYLWNGSPEYINGFFNYFFLPIKMEKFYEYFDENGIQIAEELKQFYSSFNGFRLFLSSFSFYGFPDKTQRVNPYDFILENIIIHSEMKKNNCDDSNLVFFGSFGGKYVFTYNQKTQDGYHCIKKGYRDVILTFMSLSDLIDFFVTRIIPHYNDRSEKICPNIEYIDIPVLANSIWKMDELLLDGQK